VAGRPGIRAIRKLPIELREAFKLWRYGDVQSDMLTKHLLEAVLGEVRAANLQHRLYQAPADNRKLTALAWLHDAEAVLWVSGGGRALGGYWAIVRGGEAESNPLKSDGLRSIR
jgi:hypothetical protein